VFILAWFAEHLAFLTDDVVMAPESTRPSSIPTGKLHLCSNINKGPSFTRVTRNSWFSREVIAAMLVSHEQNISH
jgi:hypothetical protein